VDKKNENVEQLDASPRPVTDGLPRKQTLLIAAPVVVGLVIAGWFGAEHFTGPTKEVGGIGGEATRTSIRSCDSSWLNQKVEALKKRCYLSNIEKLRPVEGEIFRQYDELSQAYHVTRYASNGVTLPEKELQEFRQLWLPEENYFRRMVNELSASDELKSLKAAHSLYLGQISALSIKTETVQRSLEGFKNRPKEPESQPTPYSWAPTAGSASNAIPIIGKSGPFNTYEIQPKDDLDALKYFSRNTVYQPQDLAKLLPIIEKATSEQFGLTCEYLCADSQGQIVGRTRIYVDDHPEK